MHVGFASVKMSSGHLLFKAPKSHKFSLEYYYRYFLLWLYPFLLLYQLDSGVNSDKFISKLLGQDLLRDYLKDSKETNSPSQHKVYQDE